MTPTLACPGCRAALDASAELVCRSCSRTYPTVDGVRVLLPEYLTNQQIHQSEYFDAEFSSYDRYCVEPWRRSYLERIGSALHVEAQRNYLDVGVGGSGASVIEVAKQGVHSVGCDLSVRGLSQAAAFAVQEGVDDRTTFVACAAERLPFPDAEFACASAVAVLEHIDDDESALRELARVVEPDGRVWVTVPLAYRYMPPFVWPWYWWHDRRIGHKRHYDEGRLVQSALAAGLVHDQTIYSGHPIKLVQHFVDRYGRRVVPGRQESLWWRLERLDRRAERRALWALQLHAVFRRAPS